ncbi:MAG: FtsH protease activity modulator HflK [Lachnospiraceae bacterium]|nr:FtsH protease activity modulator HflK [Lachnospiraceae bacterium]
MDGPERPKGGVKKILPKILGAVIIILALGFIGLDGFYRVSEQENAVLTMFGKVIRTDTAGLYFKIPFIQQVNLVDMTTHGTGIGYSLDDGQNIDNTDDSIMITSDFNLLDIDFYLEYKVNDPIAYIYNSNAPEEVLRNLTIASIRSVVSDYTIDDAMTTGKGAIQSEVKERLQTQLSDKNIGLTVVNISIQDADPPTADVVKAFKAVENAKQGKDTALNNAKQYQNEQIPAAKAEADRIKQNAEAKKAARIAEAEGQAARFNQMYDQYKLNPLITKQRIFYETMEDILPGLKVIITDGQTQTLLPLENFAGAGEAAAPAAGAETEGEEAAVR